MWLQKVSEIQAYAKAYMKNTWLMIPFSFLLPKS